MQFKHVLLVGHGVPAQGTPRDLVARLKALEGARRARGTPMGEEERALDARIRAWPRGAGTDRYAAGMERLAEALRRQLPGAEVRVAYNEFCAPSIEDAVRAMAQAGAEAIDVVPTMVTPGGVHSEVEIPEILAELRLELPHVVLRYAWPFDLDRIATLLAERVRSG
jgi:sirohydrochlorin cobaltochelatase